MLNKKQARINLKQTRYLLGESLFNLRREHTLTLWDLHTKTGVPTAYLEKLELGMVELNLGYLNQIARAFDKKILISFT